MSITFCGRIPQKRHSTAVPASAHSQTVTLILDTDTIHAITANREARTREIQREGQNLPAGSFGRQNRETIAFHEARTAVCLRAVEGAYQAAIHHEATPAPDLLQLHPVNNTALGRERELE